MAFKTIRGSTVDVEYSELLITNPNVGSGLEQRFDLEDLHSVIIVINSSEEFAVIVDFNHTAPINAGRYATSTEAGLLVAMIITAARSPFLE